MRLIKELSEFYETLEPISGEDNCGIVPCLNSDRFFPYRLKELLKFCAENPGYHIATQIDSFTTVNKFIESGKAFYLCTGDFDPEIVFFFEYRYEYERELELSEFDED